MVHRCCISSCGMNVRVAEAKGLSYHSFPNKEPVREQWIQAIIPHLDKPEIFKVVSKYTRVCSRHFRKKDFSVDIKKRARLNSNAVPSVFPRKNTPIVVPNVLPVSPKGLKCKGPNSSPSLICSSTPLSIPPCSAIVVSSSSPSEIISLGSTTTTLLTTVTWTLDSNSECATTTIDTSGLPREFLIESATLTDDQLTLTMVDPEAASSLSQEDQSQGSNLSLNEDDSNDAPHQKRKRRKWNRTAFDRPAKGKKTVSADESNIDGVGEALAEISLSTLLAIAAPELQDKLSNSQSESQNLTERSQESSEGSSVLRTVSLPLDNASIQNMPPEHVQHLSSIEQELLQSIQAVSLHCGEPENESQGLQDAENQYVLGLTSFVPPFIHHHSSEESLFSNEDEVLSTSIENAGSNVELQSSTASSTSPTDGDFMAQIAGVGIDDRIPTVLEIENLANHLNSSLLTTGPLTLSIKLEDLHLPSAETVDKETPDPNSGSAEVIEAPFCIESPAVADVPKSPIPQRKKKAVEDVRLTGVTKKHKKEKMGGRFSVERFSNSDKDIEYYTGFTSYRNFEAFFRSLEAYVERLRVTDVMFGVTNLDKLQKETSDIQTGVLTGPNDFISPLPPPPALDEPQKRRPFHGRSMSRIDELFMTVIRLKRKLPEKVLGHMFCISQPTVSRIIRAWTVLLSKLIDCYPVESSNEKNKTPKAGTKSNAEHSYTSRGLGIPESFRQLFHCDLAKSIVVTCLNAKDKKVNVVKSFGSLSKRSKKSRVEEIDLLSENTTSSNFSNFTSLTLDTEDSATSTSESSILMFHASDNLKEGTEFFQAVDFL